ncbi:MAG TPA: LLM class F420-dependent oxidoreductase [Solirubrobacteraceae bacterium]
MANIGLGDVGVWSITLGAFPAEREREAVGEIEALGFPTLWLGEGSAHKEAFAHAGIVLAATERLKVATGIANIYGRDPLAMRYGADALGEAYPGRFVLGIGVSHAPLVGPRGHDYGKPVATMRAYLDAMDEAGHQRWAPETEVPLVLAALRPKMLELARDRAAGAHPYLVTPEHTARAREVLGPEPLLAPEQAVFVETDPERARERARRFLAGYLSLPNYRNSLRWLGFSEDDVNGPSDDLVDALVAWGEPDAIAARVRAHHEAGADHVCIQPIGNVDALLEQLRVLAPVLL